MKKKACGQEVSMFQNIPPTIFVSIYPGTITLARNLAHSRAPAPSAAIARVSATTPAFVEAYVAAPTPPLVACRDDMLIMHFVKVLMLALVSVDFWRDGPRITRRAMVRHANIVPWRFVRSMAMICSSLVRGRREV